MRVVLISTYDLGRQPFGLASPAAWLRADGHEVTTMDLSREPPALEAVRTADWIAFHLPMHAATRTAIAQMQAARALNPEARICCYGLYAPVNEEMLRGLGATHVIGGEFERALADVIAGRTAGSLPVILDRLPFRVPDRTTLPDLRRYAGVMRGGERKVAGYTEASRGCKHLCRHCPIVPVYEGRFRVVQREIVLADIRQQVRAGAVIGKVGASTRGVEKLLRRIGFRYADRVDPFDGGPHFTARMEEISLVTQTRVEANLHGGSRNLFVELEQMAFDADALPIESRPCPHIRDGAVDLSGNYGFGCVHTQLRQQLLFRKQIERRD